MSIADDTDWSPPDGGGPSPHDPVGVGGQTTSHKRAALGLVTLAVALACAGLAVARHRQADRLIAADPESVLGDAHLRDTALTIGRPIFAQRCAPCHGADARGNRGGGIPDLTDGDYLYGAGRVGDVEQIVLHGIRSGDSRGWDQADMPAYARQTPYAREPIPPLQPREIADVVSFLRALHGDASDAAAQRGAAIFAGKGGCWDCHGANAGGDAAIGAPNLRDDVWLYGDGSRPALMATIAYGRRGIMPAFARVLSPAQARAVAAYTASLSRLTQQGTTHAGT